MLERNRLLAVLQLLSIFQKRHEKEDLGVHGQESKAIEDDLEGLGLHTVCYHPKAFKNSVK